MRGPLHTATENVARWWGWSWIRRGAAPAAIGSLASAVLGQVALAGSGIVLARLLGAENRGYLALFLLLPMIVYQIGGLGLPVATAYHIAREPAHARDIVRSLRSLAPTLCIVGMAVHLGLIVLLFRSRPESIRIAALISLVGVPAYLAQDYGLAILQGRQRFAAFNILRTVPAVLNALVALLLWKLRADLLLTTGLLMLSASVAGVVTIATGLLGLHGKTRPEMHESPKLRMLVRFGLRSFIGSIYPAESFRPEQLVIGSLLTPAALGVYVVALSFSNLPRFVAQSLGMVAYPRIAEQLSIRDRHTLVWRYFWVTVALTGITVVTLEIAVGWLVPVLFSERFGQAAPIARLLLVGAWFFSAKRILAEGLKGAGFPGAGTVAEMASWAALGIGLLILVPLFKLFGVAAAVTISGVISLLLLIWLEVTHMRPTSLVIVPRADETTRARS